MPSTLRDIVVALTLVIDTEVFFLEENGVKVSVRRQFSRGLRPRYNDRIAGLLCHDVVRNLVSNAFWSLYPVRDGKLSGSFQRLGGVTIVCRAFSDREEISVSDTGCGVKNPAKLFCLGYSEKGTSGKGLYYAKKVVEKECGGTITYVPKKKGSMFVVVLPK